MEGGNVTPIDLEAGLDVKSSDMLVPFVRPTFQHNWQRYQGHCLPNSLRFEMNGWAAGWNVYNFDYENLRANKGNYWFGCNKLNNLPAYIVNAYQSKDSTDVLGTIVFIPESRILNTDNCTAELTDNHIIGKCNDKTFTITWNALNSSASIDNSNLSIVYEQNKDRSWKFTIKDNTSRVDISNNIYEPASLKCQDFLNEVSYDKFEDNTHYWGEYEFDGSQIIAPYAIEDITPTIVDNTVKFSYDAFITETYSLNVTYDSFILGFNDCELVSTVDDQPQLLNDKGGTIQDFNKFTGSISPNSLIARDSKGIVINTKVPVWACISFKPKGDNPEQGQWANNVRHGNVYIKSTAKFVSVLAQSVFDNTVVATDIEQADQGVHAINLNFRYNVINVLNTIEASNNFDARKNIVRSGNAWVYSTRQFANLRDDRTKVGKLIGSIYTMKNCQYKPSDYLTANNWADWSDKNNAVYTRSNIDNLQSIRRYSGVNTAIEGSDDDFTASALFTQKDLLSFIYTQSGSHSTYNASQTAHTYNDLYTSGKYTGSTYEFVGLTISNESNFWPFDYVPKFNFLKPVKNDKGEITGYTTIKGCFYVSNANGDEIITSLAEFKAKVMGTYDNTVNAENNTFESNSNYNASRVVTTYRTCFDFKYSDINKDDDSKAKWEERWDKWYAGIQNPMRLSQTDSSDTTYTNYNNTVVKPNETPVISFTTPGVVIQSSDTHDYAYSAPDEKGNILYGSNDTEGPEIHIWHNHVDATNNYDIKSETTNAKLHITYITTSTDSQGHSTEHTNTIDAAIPGYVGPNVITNVSYSKPINANVIVHDEYSNASLTSGTLKFCGEPKEGICWFNQIGLSYSNNKASLKAEVNNKTYKTSLKASLIKEQIVKKAFFLDSDAKPKEGEVNEDGIVWAMPLWGNSCTRLRYTDIGQLSTMPLKVRKLFVFENIDNDQIKDSEQHKIWIDRVDPAFENSYKWCKLSNAGLSPVEEDAGYILLKLTAIGDALTFYADKTTKEEKDTTKEIMAKYYYPTVAGFNGNMKAIRTNVRMKIQWKPDQVSLPVSIMQSLTTKNKVGHIFYKDGITEIAKATAELGTIDDFDLNTRNLPVTFNICGNEIKCSYNAGTEEFNIPTFSLSTNRADLTFAQTDAGDSIIDIPVDIVVHFTDVTGKFAMSKSDSLKTYINGRYTCTHNQTEYTFDYNSSSIVGLDTIIGITDIDNIGKQIAFTDIFTADFNAVLSNVYDNKVYFKLSGATIELNVEELLKHSTESVSVLSTDIRKPADTVCIGKVDSSEEFQFIRQQWNTTVETENFWWVDKNHILELTQNVFRLKRKTDQLDDWYGDRFDTIYEIDRSTILDSSMRRFDVTNVYYTNTHAKLLTYYAIDSASIGINVYDIINNLKLLGTLKLSLVKHNISEDILPLNNKSYDSEHIYFNTYSSLNSEQLLAQAEWSNTIRDNLLFIGCHLSNNFDQWTAIFRLDSLSPKRCIQGYGYVGLNGYITGGMTPDAYCDISIGFTSKVDSLETLNLDKDTINTDNIDSKFFVKKYEDVSEVKSSIVGTAEKQWYISKHLSGIVAGMRYIGGDKLFEKVVVPITNNYSAIYDTPSVCLGSYGDLMVSARAFKSMFNFEGKADTVWTAFMTACGMPFLAVFAPRKATMLYLQQTLGQYAYVHYNSSESPVTKELESTVKNSYDIQDINAKPLLKAPLLSDDMTFDKQIFAQNTNISQSSTDFISLMFAIFAPAIQSIDSDISINSTVSLSTVKDEAKAYSQNVMDNLAGLAAAAITNKGQGQAASSTIVGSKSLDMFYSTSDKQQVHAGPGFTEMQFVADCVAQSVTDINAQGTVQQISLFIRALTVFQGKVTMLTQLAIATGLEAAANPTAQLMVCGTSVGAAAAVVMRASATAIRKAQEITKFAYDEIDKILDELCKRGVTSELVTTFSRKEMQTEGKHKYGEKNETFMWPCWDIPVGDLKYIDETVQAAVKVTDWRCALQAAITYTDNTSIALFARAVPGTFNDDGMGSNDVKTNSFKSNFKKYCSDWNAKRNNLSWNLNGTVPLLQATCYGKTVVRPLPEDMACIQGVPNFLPKQAFKNENIGVSQPVFTPSMFQDYIVDKDWNISQCATYGKIQWISCKDTKLTNCPPSNMFIDADFCGIATSYSAIEVKRGLSKKYMRPIAITPTTLLMNCSGYNCIHDNKLYHACDGYSYRLVEWTGAPGLNKNNQTFWYAFQINDRFKRSNKFPANELQGNFVSEPNQAVKSIDKVHNIINIAAKEKGMEAGTIGEDKDLTRWSIPIFTEPVTILPAAVKTLTAMPLAVIDGITGLVTDLGNNQIAYKAPLSVDFTIGKNVYRQTEEYICSVITQNGVDVTQDLVPSLGLKFIGSTPTEAFFYSKATRCYYSFTGTSLVKMDMMERFRDIQRGYWDFVNQEVIMPCLMTFKRLNAEVEDKDTEADNIIVPVLSRSQVSGELPPPLTTIFNDRSWYKAVSLPSGFAYQGPNRVIINRQVFVEYMLDSLKDNLGKWQKMPREKYSTKRVYPDIYTDIMTDVKGVKGWTYNPFLLVTSALGQSENDDCMFEWIITFCWPIEMDLIYGPDNYACINIMAETMTPGGKITCRPTHVFLKKELFTRTGNYGYYSFRFQSKNGAGNRERLHIWSDQYIAISSIDCDCKVVSSRRNEQLVQQLDVQKLKEL